MHTKFWESLIKNTKYIICFINTTIAINIATIMANTEMLQIAGNRGEFRSPPNQGI